MQHKVSHIQLSHPRWWDAGHRPSHSLFPHFNLTSLRTMHASKRGFYSSDKRSLEHHMNLPIPCLRRVARPASAPWSVVMTPTYQSWHRTSGASHDITGLDAEQHHALALPSENYGLISSERVCKLCSAFITTCLWCILARCDVCLSLHSP